MSCCILASTNVPRERSTHPNTYDPIDSNSVSAQHMAGTDGGRVDVAVEAVEHAAQLAAFPAV